MQGGLIPFAAKTIREKFRAGSRLVVAVGGPPASGKTAFSEALVKSLNDNPEKPIQSCLVSIDGFRLDTSQFESLGILPHWGAKRSFDFDGIRNLLEGIRVSRSPVFYPVYDRTKERAVPGAGVVSPETDIVIVKGNYLLLDDQPWIELETLFDLEFFLDTPMPRCLIPWFDGAIHSVEWKDALWDRYVMAAPRPRTPSEQQYSDRKLRTRS